MELKLARRQSRTVPELAALALTKSRRFCMISVGHSSAARGVEVPRALNDVPAFAWSRCASDMTGY